MSYDIGRIDIRPNSRVPKNLAGRMSSELKKWTGKNWIVSLSQQIGEDTLYEQDLAEQEALRQLILKNELVKSVMQQFEGAKLSDIQKIQDEFVALEQSFDPDFPVSAAEFGLDDDD